ncbi:MAG: hypothetical protein COW71_15175 [Ignavibacteriales bacterium CG18_big_fil_WC_8_21_14_2_50_31_20]|nr:MAG: hypothetical protein COW71_15175 [Ignavibacteriales bacterium CG18_big_fil_WC_8_21_14_2_50_31_20]
MKLILNYTFFIILLIFLFACDQKVEDKSNIYKEKVLLSENEEINEALNISFYIPHNYTKMPSSLKEKLVGRINKKGDDEFIFYVPNSYFYNDKNKSLFQVGIIKLKNIDSNDSLSIEKYITIYKKFNNGLNIETSDLINTIIQIKQLKIIKNKLMTFKFLFMNHNKEIIQIDFSINQSYYGDVFPTVIATIKSIKLL